VRRRADRGTGGLFVNHDHGDHDDHGCADDDVTAMRRTVSDNDDAPAAATDDDCTPDHDGTSGMSG